MAIYVPKVRSSVASFSYVKEMSEIMCNVCGQKCLYCQNFYKYSDHRTSYHLCPPEFARHMYTCQNIPAVKGILWEIGEKSKKKIQKKKIKIFLAGLTHQGQLQLGGLNMSAGGQYFNDDNDDGGGD